MIAEGDNESGKGKIGWMKAVKEYEKEQAKEQTKEQANEQMKEEAKERAYKQMA